MESSRAGASGDVRPVLSLDTQRHVHGVLGCGYLALPARMLECLGDENPSVGRIDPVCLVNAIGQIEYQPFFVSPGHDLVNVGLELAVVMIEGILLPALAHAAIVGADGHPAHHKAAIRPHLQEMKAFYELFQALHRLENGRVLSGLSGWVSSREHAVQIVET